MKNWIGGLVFLVIGAAMGYFLAQRPVKIILGDLVELQVQRDSLQAINDTLHSQIDFLFVEKSGEKVKETIRYITKIKEVETEKYLQLDTDGRVEHFREWVVDSTNRYLANRSLEATRFD